MLLLSVLLIIQTHGFLRNPFYSKSSRLHSTSTITTPTTYIPIEIMNSSGSSAKRTTFLVKSNEVDIIEEIKKWQGKLDIDDSKLSLWSSQGKAFSLNSKGTDLLYKAEKSTSEKINIYKKKKPINSNVDTYVDLSTKNGKSSYLVKTSRLQDALSGRKGIIHLMQRGEAFNNVTELLIDHNITSRADDIAVRIRNEFPLASPEWQRWTNKTDQYNATSLTQVISEYFSGHSTGDIGGPEADYVSKRGYPGTLAPGENFLENNPFSELSNHILHPWPAMQEFQFHVRMPPNHPMLPPMPLWFGLNNMYTENYAANQLSKPSTETVGGMMMLPKDAIRIARFHKIGMCYDPADQVEHGGMIFKTGKQIPFYHPDHGPTVSEEEARPPVPEELLPITERWLDPFFGIVGATVSMPEATGSLQEEMEEEEAVRIAAAERLVSLMPKKLARDLYEAEELRLDEEDIERRRQRRLQRLSGIDEEMEADEENKPKDVDEPMLDRRAQRMQDKVIKGFARDPRSLITYSIETIRDLSLEITIAARRDDSNKKSGRRSKVQKKERRPAIAEETLPTDEALPFDPEAPLIDVEEDAVDMIDIGEELVL